MELEYNILAIEVTRRCNQRCEGFCMRGEAQNLDIDFKYIDKLLENDFKGVSKLVFTGGEPTLNPEVIAYTIDKIIEANLPFVTIDMVTNGLVYSQKIVDAFERFCKYVKNSDILGDFSEFGCFVRESLLKGDLSFANISFSNDSHHKGISSDVINSYYDNCKDTRLSMMGEPTLVLRSGFSNYGLSMKNSIDNKIVGDLVVNGILLTTKGNVCLHGAAGSYDFIDSHSVGNSILHKSLNEYCLDVLPREKEKVKIR